MEPNTYPTAQTDAPPIQPVQNPKFYFSSKIKFIILFFMIFLITFVGIGSFYLGTQQNKSTKLEVASENQPTPTQAKSDPTPAISSMIKNTGLFQHPKANYSLEYPESWNVELIPIPSAIKQDYQDFIGRSPDYKLTEGYPFLEKGAEFFVRAENSSAATIDEIFNNDPLLPEIASNKIKTTVDGTQAIQFDYNYEATIATMTIFLKNGKYYTLKYRYVDKADKQNNWNDYLNLLYTFKSQ